MSYFVSEYIDEDNCVSYSSIRTSYYDKIHVSYRSENCKDKKNVQKRETSCFIPIEPEESWVPSAPISISSSASSDSYESYEFYKYD